MPSTPPPSSPKPSPLLAADLPLAGRQQGKVRDCYDAALKDGRAVRLIIATDRISAFDVVMANGVPGKGRLLTQLSAFWFEQITQRLGPTLGLGTHLLSTDVDDIAGLDDDARNALRWRVTAGRPAKVIPMECVVRGYLAGSGWTSYRESGSVCGVPLPEGLRMCDRLPEPIFTPTSKAESGHDEPLSPDEARALVGESRYDQLKTWSRAIYQMAHDLALQRGVIIADTKFEFGVPLDDPDGEPILIDEALTPDSSRFWPAERYHPGEDQPSFDKQYVRNYLLELVDQGKWDKTPPGPTLPEEVVANTLERYVEAWRRLTGDAAETPAFLKRATL